MALAQSTCFRNPFEHAFTSNGGGAYAIPGQPLTMQVSDQNTGQPSMFQLSNAPAGMTIDPVTGAITWTPTLNDLGTVSPTVTANNSAGITNITLSIPVDFASPVNSVVGTGSLADQSISLTWSDPTTTSEPLAGYNIYLSWIDGTGTTVTSDPIFIPYGTDAATLAATPGYTTFTIKIVAVDSSGWEGASPDFDTVISLV